MKKVFLSLVLACGLSFNASAVMSGVTFGASTLMMYAGALSSNVAVYHTVKGIFSGDKEEWIKAAKYAAIGLILLDETGTIEFDRIEGDMKGVSASDIEIYNSELEELNVVAQEIASNFDENTTLEDSHQLWKDYGANLSPETMEVVKAIVRK